MHYAVVRRCTNYGPQTPRGPKKGQKGPFGATHGKNGIDGLEATEICLVLPVGVFRIDS